MPLSSHAMSYLMQLTGLYQAKVKRIGRKNERTGIYKYSVAQAEVNHLGLVHDVQVDKRYHGGPERALHQYALRSYEKIIKANPLLHKRAIAGSMGENLSIATMHEGNVNIGDIYQIGNCQIQVSGPRMPCFKISEKFNTPNLDKFVAKYGIHGWYYRVLQDGRLSQGDTVRLVERLNQKVSIKLILDIIQNKGFTQEQLENAIQANGLDPEWQQKLSNLNIS